MNYRNLGRTGLKGSELCLGSMQFGWTADEKAGREVLDAFVEAGGNFVDTADVYSRWHPGNPGGVAEEIIGRWMKERGNRRSIVLATKVRGRMGPGPNDEGLSRRHILDAVEASLRRLQTDTLDLYQAHFFDDNTPIEETLRAFDDLVRAGKVRYIGASNYPAWRLVESLWRADVLGTVRYDSLQPHYNVAYRREFEQDLRDVCQKHGLGVIPYSPLAGGFLTGKYDRNNVPSSARADSVKARYFNEVGWRTLEAVQAVATELGTTPTAVSLAWLLRQPTVTAPIIGAKSVEQLRDNLAALDVKLSDEQVKRLDEASRWQQ